MVIFVNKMLLANSSPPCLFPRLQKLRLSRNGPPPHTLCGKLTHISKKKSIKSGIYYKVTICRECSDSNETVTLGCFADLESAVLANDVYEILSHRKAHVYQLTDEDMNFANDITVSRTWRNQVVEVNLMQLMQENVSRSEINPDEQSSGIHHGSNEAKTLTGVSDSYTENGKRKKKFPSSEYRRAMANRYLQLMDANANFITALKCVPQAAGDVKTIFMAMAKLSMELHYSGQDSLKDESTPKIYNIKNLEAILTSATTCGLISISAIQLLTSSCLESDCSDGQQGNGLTGFIRGSLGDESLLTIFDITLIRNNMSHLVNSNQTILVWGEMMQQLLR